MSNNTEIDNKQSIEKEIIVEDLKMKNETVTNIKKIPFIKGVCD